MFSKLYILTAALIAAVSLCGADILLDKARSGDPASQVQLAGEYFYGKNRRQSLPLANYWFRKAAQAGFPQGQYNFALCLFYGWGGEKNHPAAFVYFEKAMKSGVDKAAVRYAEMLFNGVESGRFDNKLFPAVPADREKALDILRHAVDRNLVKRRIREAYRTSKHPFVEALENNGKKMAVAILYIDTKHNSTAFIKRKMEKLLDGITSKAGL